RAVGVHRDRGLLPPHHGAGGHPGQPDRAEGGVRAMSTSTVLYDAPGPVTRRRQRMLSALAGLLILAVFAAGIVAMYRNGIFNDRWLRSEEHTSELQSRE